MTRDAAGRFTKGHSGNPSGVSKAAKAPGTDSVITYGGFIPNVEGNYKLVGIEKWKTYQNAANEAVVALGIRYFANLLAGAEWHAELNPSGDPKAAKGVEIVERGLLSADLPKPWNLVVPKAAMFLPYGFSLHATAMRRMDDGMIVYSDIAHRPQHTVWRWDKPDETEPLQGVWQRSFYTGKEYYIPLDQAFYCVDDALTDSPEGTGLLRHVIELVRRLQRFQVLEAIGYEFDIGGLPVAYAPLSELYNAAPGDAAEKKAFVDAATLTMRTVLAQRAKTPERQQFLSLDSAPYANPDGTLTSTPKWEAKVLRADFAGAPNITALIARIQLEIARVFGVEFAMIGGGQTAGTYGMHEDKTSMFATNLETTGTKLGAFATDQLARRLIRANGLDPDTCTPKLVMEPISTDSIEAVTRSLANLQLAMLDPSDPAIKVLRKRMRLPPPPDKPPPAPLPTLPRRGPPSAPQPPTNDNGGGAKPGEGDKAKLEEAPEKPGAHDQGEDQLSVVPAKRTRRAAR